MKNRHFINKGFSLVETLIYIGLLAMIIASLVGMLVNMSRAYKQIKISRQVQTSAVSALDRIVRDIRNAESVDLTQSSLNTNPGILALNTTDAGNSPQVLKFFISSGVLRMSQGGSDLGPITMSNTIVSNLVFRLMNTGISEAVKIEMTLISGGKSGNFYATATLRDSY